MKLTKKDIKRFWSKVDKTGDCWEWTACRVKDGYGYMKIKSKNVKTHRVSYEISNSPIPPGMCVLHSCDNPGCVNPRHLFIGTQRDNIQDMIKKRRNNHPKGENNNKAKLTKEQVLEIRAKYASREYSVYKLADEYEVDFTNIYRIINRKTWTHI